MLQIPLRKLERLSPEPGELDRYERASVDELRAWQRERLGWTLRHAYDNVAHYHAAFDVAGVHPDDCRDLTDLDSPRGFPPPGQQTQQQQPQQQQR